MTRPPLSFWILTLVGIALAIWLAVQGLHIRLFGDYLSQYSMPSLWFIDSIGAHDLPLRLIVHPALVAWPLLVLGLAWWGALFALWMGIDWGGRVVTLLLLCSLLVPLLGSLLAMIGLICRTSPSMRAWLLGER